MQPGRQHNKELTSVHGSGVTNSGTPVATGARMHPYTVPTSSQNPHIAGEDDSHRTLTGPGMGSHAAGAGNHSQKWGHTTPSGTQVSIDDTPGSESINIIHHSGAGITVEPDGSIFFSSTSKRGAGISAPLGDVFISAGGEIVIDGPGTISVSTKGDLNLNVGGTLNIVAGAIKTTTKALDETIDGYATRSVTNDQSSVIGGINRVTVAGDQRTQVSGNDILDVGATRTEKIEGDLDVNVSGASKQKTTGEYTNHSTGAMSHVTAADMKVDATGNSQVVAGGTLTTSSEGAMKVASGSTIDFGGASNVKISAGGTLRASSTSSELSSTGTTKVSGGSVEIGGSSVSIKTGSFLAPTPSPSSGSMSGFKDAAPATIEAAEVEEATPADYPAAEDVVDSMTTVRKYPEYPNNGMLESAVATNYRQIEYDQTPGADSVYGEITRSNSGNMNPSYVGGSMDTLPEEPINRDPNITAVEPPISAPARNDNSGKISRYFTLGTLTRAAHSDQIPHSSWDSVVKNHILVAYNVLDPIKERFPDVIITSAYRVNSSNHITGRAIDIVVPSRSLTKHAEIAKFARDNLPVEKVLLERNDSGRTHVHVQVTPSGARSTNPIVFTCSDKKCAGKTPGINVEWLERNA